MTTALGFILITVGFIKFSWDSRVGGGNPYYVDVYTSTDAERDWDREHASENGQKLMIGLGMILLGVAILGFKILAWIFGSM